MITTWKISMALFEIIPTWLQIILFPIIVLGIWTLLFNSQNSLFTQLVVEGGYLILVVPIIILTFLSIPMMALIFWAAEVGIAKEITIVFGLILGILTIIIEYFYLKRMIRKIEEREQMSFWDYIRREMDPKTKKEREQKKIETKEEAVEFFDEISEMNKRRRQIDKEEKEKLRKALLGDIDRPNKSEE